MEEIKTPRKLFTVLIGKSEYDVYDIDGKEHGGYNGEPKTWWIYHSERLPDGLMPPSDSDSFKPYHNSIMRHVWTFNIKQGNSTKEKWGETQFRNGTQVEMICNGKPVYSFGTSGKALDYAFAKIQYLMVQMGEHPYNFFEPEKENGRKIYWYGLPATIKTGYEAGEIHIVPDYNAGLTKEEWWAELKRRETKIGGNVDSDFAEMEKDSRNEAFERDCINWGDALSDQHIDWFRR